MPKEYCPSMILQIISQRLLFSNDSTFYLTYKKFDPKHTISQKIAQTTFNTEIGKHFHKWNYLF